MSNRIIPKEALRNLQRVELGNFGAPMTPPVAVQPREAAKNVPPAASVDPRLLEQARAEGYANGVAEGARQAQGSLDAERAALHALATNLNQLMQDLEQGLSNDVLSMSLELAKLIVRQAVRVKPELLLPALREAIGSLPALDDQTTVRLHPADAALLREAAAEDATLALPWKIVEDNRIERGGCVLETATTEVDATLETRWRRVIAALGRDDLWTDITT